MLYVLVLWYFIFRIATESQGKNRKWLIKKLLRFSCFRIRKCPHFVSIGCNGKQIGVFGLHCRQDLFAIPGEKIINPTD